MKLPDNNLLILKHLNHQIKVYNKLRKDIDKEVKRLKYEIELTHRNMGGRQLNIIEEISKRKKKMANKLSKNLDSMALKNLKEGSVYYSDKTDNVLTGLAVYYGRKIETRKIIMLDASSMRIKKMIKVKLIK